jgi:hypothetical protein
MFYGFLVPHVWFWMVVCWHDVIDPLRAFAMGCFVGQFQVD